MSRKQRPHSDSTEIPEPGRRGATDVTGEAVTGVSVRRDREGRKVISRLGHSGVGPGAGEDDVVRVEAPVQHEDDPDVPRHPTLRGRTRRPGGG